MAGKHPSNAELKVTQDPIICQLHSDRVERLITSVETLSADLRDLVVHKERTNIQLENIGNLVGEMRAVQSTIAANVTHIQLTQQMQGNEITSLKKRLDDHSDVTKRELQKLKDTADDHSSKIMAGHLAAPDVTRHYREQTTALTKKKTSPFQMGEGWISVVGLIKVLGAVAALIAAYYGGKAG